MGLLPLWLLLNVDSLLSVGEFESESTGPASDDALEWMSGWGGSGGGMGVANSSDGWLYMCSGELLFMSVPLSRC